MPLAFVSSCPIIIGMNIDQESILLSIKGLLDEKPYLRQSHLGNALAVLKTAMPVGAWIGLYLFSERDGKLLLGPFQGTPACEEISVGKGVVGDCFQIKKSIVVPNVREYPNYICCDESANSEICVPLLKKGSIIGVFDIDFPKGHDITEWLEIFEEVAKILPNWL